MTIKKKREGQFSFASEIWNEFLFAREFEYESPLSPDEIAVAIRTMEKQKPRSGLLLLGFNKFEDKLSLERYSDKAINFKICVKDDERSWQKFGFNFHQTEGSITVNPQTGMTIIKGKAHFSGEYYLFIILGLGLNLIVPAWRAGLAGNIFLLGWLFLGWFSIYQERNALVNRLAAIIIQAESSMILDGENLEESQITVESQNLSESE
jgi:hypothetical protein